MRNLPKDRPAVAHAARHAREVLLIATAFPLYTLVHALVRGRIDEAEANGRAIFEMERSLGVRWEPWLQDQVLAAPVLLRLLNLNYVYGFLPVIAIAALFLYLRFPAYYGLVRNAFLLSGGIGLVVYYLFPAAPPRLLDGYGFVDTVFQHFNAERPYSPAFLVNQYAAMPSLHFGWILLLGGSLSLLTKHLLRRLLALLMPAAMFLTIVATANHYVLDAVAGFLVVALGLALAGGARRVGRRCELVLAAAGFRERLRGAVCWLTGVPRSHPANQPATDGFKP